MMEQKKVKQNRKNYILIISLFFLAGFCQYFDSFLPLFWKELLSKLANSIFFFIGIIWSISISERIIDPILKRKLILVSTLLTSLILLRFLKYDFFLSNSWMSKYLWYSYYIPLIMAPVLWFLAILGIDNKNGKPISKKWNLIYIPAFFFVMLVLTNDSNQLVFKFKDHLLFNDYKYGIGYSIILFFSISLVLAGCGILFYKSRVLVVKKKIWQPFIVFIILSSFSIFLFYFNSTIYKVPELLGMILISLIETCIRIGLIPSNRNYHKYFNSSVIGSLICDNEYQVKYKSINFPPSLNHDLVNIDLNNGLVKDNMRYCVKKIHGGKVFWQEDIKDIISLTSKLEEITKELQANNDLILAENKLKEDKIRIEEQNKLYDSITEIVQPQLQIIENIVNNIDIDSKDFENKMKLTCVYGSYVKRRSNFVIIGNGQKKTQIKELSFAIRESLRYLSNYGVDSSFICNIENDSVTHKSIELIYDFIEKNIEAALPGLNAIIINIYRKNTALICRLTMNGATRIIDQIEHNDDISLDIFTDYDSTSYLTMTIKGGAYNEID